MFYSFKNRTQIFSGIFIILLAACGGGGSSVDTAGITRSGAPATSTAGPISGFGSVIVNGIRYHSDKAVISASDDNASEADLRTGLQVHITGTLNTDGTGEATNIEFFPNILGSITAKDSITSQLVVLGQIVQINNATIFGATISPNFIDGLNVGDSVQISGMVNAQNILIATRIDLINTTQLRVLGKVSNLDTTNSKFTINNLVVNYSAAQQKDFNNLALANNMLVFVKGNTLNAQNELVAQNIKLMQSVLRNGSKHAEISGLVTRFVSLSDFDVGTVSCSTSSPTTFEDGAATDISLGAQVQVVGEINANGILIVTKVHLQKHENTAMAGVVSNIQANTSGAIVTGSFVLDGVTVLVNNLTRVEDKSTSDLKRFNLSDLHAGDFVKVAGYLVGSNMIATQIERNTLQTNNELRIEGVITQVLADSFKLNDRHVVVNAQTELRDLNGQSLSSVAFLAMALNKNVEVRGLLSNGVFTAKRVEIKSNSGN